MYSPLHSTMDRSLYWRSLSLLSWQLKDFLLIRNVLVSLAAALICLDTSPFLWLVSIHMFVTMKESEMDWKHNLPDVTTTTSPRLPLNSRCQFSYLIPSKFCPLNFEAVQDLARVDISSKETLEFGETTSLMKEDHPLTSTLFSFVDVSPFLF